MLKPLPDIRLPVTQRQVDPLMEGVVQLNILDAGLTENSQRGLALYLHTFDLWVKSGGTIDYRGDAGHQRLMDDAMRFVGPGNPVATRHGDLQAAHLMIDWHDAQMRLKSASEPLLSANVNELLAASVKLAQYPIETEKRVSLLMDYLGKRMLV